MPLNLALGRQKQVDFCEFKANLVFKVSSRTGSIATEKPCLEKKQINKKTQTNKQTNKKMEKASKKEKCNAYLIVLII